MSNYVYEEAVYIPTEDNPLVLQSGRKIYRHSNNEGSVLVFDQYGTQTKLYVPDAKYRDFSYKEISAGLGTNTQLHTPILEINSIDDYDYLLGLKKAFDEPFTNDEFLTDSQLQSKLDSMLSSGTFADDFNAQDGTDAILLNLDATSQAALAVRDLVPTGLIGCNLPNIYELSVIWLESDNIDSIDPTINEYSNKGLGSPVRFRTGAFWTCTEIHRVNNYFYRNTLADNGMVYHYTCNITHYALPVLEL